MFEDKGTIERIQQILENLDQRGQNNDSMKVFFENTYQSNHPILDLNFSNLIRGMNAFRSDQPDS